MIEALTNFPDNVIAIACHGHVTKADYETVLIPDIENKLSRHKRCGSTARSRLIMSDSIPARSGKIRRSASAKSRDWERAAMVTDVEWMRHAAKLFGGFFDDGRDLLNGAWLPAVRRCGNP